MQRSSFAGRGARAFLLARGARRLYQAAMATTRTLPRITRRRLLVGGGVGAGLVLAWGLWPRAYLPNLRAGPGETLFNAFLRIGSDGRVIVAVPQAELGQGAWTSLPQILADELGAAWETVAVEPAPLSPIYANTLLEDQAGAGSVPGLLETPVRWAERTFASRGEAVTAGSTSVRGFEQRMREAGSAARALLMKAAARRWEGDWETLDTAAGFVIGGAGKLRFAELAEEAAKEELPEYLPIRGGIENRLYGMPLPRIDLPSKVDGSARFAGDVRLPGMLYASVRAAPTPGSRLAGFDLKGPSRIPGVMGIFDTARWVGAVASNWWAADRAVESLNARWEIGGDAPTDAAIAAGLTEALRADEGSRLFSRGDIASVYAGGGVLRATYTAGPAPNAPLETLTATARFSGDLLEVWAPTQAPGIARAAAARIAGLPEAQVTVYPTLIGGGYGRKLEVRAIEQAVALAGKAGKPVQLVWSRKEETVQDTVRPAARGEMTARLGEGGVILGWQARIAAPDLGAQLERRLGEGAEALRGAVAPAAGAIPPYAIPAVAVDHLPAPASFQAGYWRSAAHSYTAFFTESWVDELSRQANIEPLSFRMQMLGDNPRLARCLQTAAALGGWDGGQSGSSMGIAAHSAFGSHIAALVEVEIEADQRVRVLRAVCAVDCGRVVNPAIVAQQVEGGLLFGIAAASAAPIRFENGRPSARGFGQLGFPTLARSPDVSVEILPSEEEPGGVTELAVPVSAPAMANALYALTGRRLRSLPLVVGAS